MRAYEIALSLVGSLAVAGCGQETRPSSARGAAVGAGNDGFAVVLVELAGGSERVLWVFEP